MENVSSLYKAWKIFCNGSLLYAAIPAALILLFIQARKKERAYLGLVLLLLAAAIYNPFSYRILTDIVGSSNYRIFWLLPGWAAFSYLVFCLLRLLPSEKIRYILTVLACAAGILYAARRNEYTYTVSNIYQIPSETICLADRMAEILDERGMETAVVYGNYDFLSTLRQYNPRFILHVAPRSHFIMEEHAYANDYLGIGHQLTTGSISMDPQFASELLIDNEVYFIVLYRSLTDSIDYLGEMGWQEVTGTDTFAVLCQDRFSAEDAQGVLPEE